MHPSEQVFLIRQYYMDKEEIIQKHSSACLIEKQWWESWCSFVGFHGEASSFHPGPIPNHVLLEQGSYKLSIEEQSVMVIHAVWDKLQQWYQGGPELKVYIVKGRADYNPIRIRVSDTEEGLLYSSRSFYVSQKMIVHDLEKLLCSAFCVDQRKVVLSIFLDYNSIPISGDPLQKLKNLGFTNDCYVLIDSHKTDGFNDFINDQNSNPRKRLRTLENLPKANEAHESIFLTEDSETPKHIQQTTNNLLNTNDWPTQARNDTDHVRMIVEDAVYSNKNLKIGIRNWTSSCEAYYRMIDELREDFKNTE